MRWGEDSIFNAPAGVGGEARPAGGVEGVYGFHQANGADGDQVLLITRQGEIWFAERTAEHSTQLYSLSEFKTRSDKSILNDYVQGRYGAVPCILENDHKEG